MKELIERERSARGEAEEASRSKDEFLAMLGHELRNPLSPILTALHLIRLRGSDDIAREVSVIERQAQHLVRLTVRLPAHGVPSAVARDKKPDPRDVKSKRLRVLVVDDNQDAAEMLAEALQLLGCQTALAHDGPEALRVAAEFQPDAALLDIGLPVMDGYELAQRLRAQFGEELKLIAITGYGQESDRQRSRAAGCQEHLTKPVDLEKLAQLLAKMTPAAGGGFA